MLVSFKLLVLCAACTFLVLMVALYFITDESNSELFQARRLHLRQESNHDGVISWKDLYSIDGSQPFVEKLSPLKEIQENDDSLKPPITTSRRVSYILTRTFGGQMTRAIKNMMLQQCWAGYLGHTSYVVEPFSAHSNLYHSPSFWSDVAKGKLHKATRFSGLYDLQYYNQKSRENKSAQLVTWENFLENAPREVVILNTATQSCTNSSSEKVKLLSTCSLSKEVQDLISGLKKYNFKVVNMTCVSCSDSYSRISLTELHDDLLARQQASNVTILINMWRNFQKTTQWLQLPQFCSRNEASSSLTRLRPSQFVIDHTQYYKTTFIKSKMYVAMMFRIERFLTEQEMERTNDTLSSCVNNSLEIHNRLTESRMDMGTFLTLDVGRFGSQIMQNYRAVSKLAAVVEDTAKTISSLAEQTVKHIYNGRFTLKAWEDTFIEATGGITEMGYIAMLQRDIATEADCLILMGGGYYQQVAAYQYFKNHPDPSSWCLYYVCVAHTFDTFTK